MRPRLKLVLLARTPMDASLWRLRLQVRGWQVLPAEDAEHAMHLVEGDPEIRLLVSQYVDRDALDRLAELADAGHKVLVFEVPKGLAVRLAPGAFLRTEESTPTEVLLQVRLRMARKRGPIAAPASATRTASADAEVAA